MITGTGTYVTRDGDKMEIIGMFDGRWIGFPSGTKDCDTPSKLHRFDDDGTFSNVSLGCDIVGPWVEPKEDIDLHIGRVTADLDTRDWFAGQHLATLGSWCFDDPKQRARECYRMADEMMAERRKAEVVK